MAKDETQTLEQTLDRTDFGHMINENKKGILIGAAIIVVLIIGYSIFHIQSEKKYEKNLTQVYTFQKDVIDKYLAGKMNDSEFISKIKSLPAHIKGQPSLLPPVLEATDKLVKAKKSNEAISILESWEEAFNKGSYNYFFLALKMAPLYENAGKIDKAIDITEKLVASSINIAKGHHYLNLGRLYLEKGNKEKAKQNFDFILENHKKTQAAKLAKLYLGQL